MSVILLTAIGSASAASAIAAYQAQGHRVIGCNIYPQSWNVESTQVDAFFQALPAKDTNAYLNQMEEAVRREQVEFLIPLTDVEVDVLCEQKSRFAALGCTVCTPDAPATRLCRNKRRMAKVLADAGICQTIPTRSPYGYQPTEADFPMILKPESGRSSQGLQIVHSIGAFQSALSMRSDYIAQPYLDGDVFTVDVARDVCGNVQALARQELLRTVNGLGITVSILPEHPLNVICAAIARQADIVGVVNMEFIHHNDDYYFLEVNPRYSGGLGFSLLAGVNFAQLELLCHQDKSIGSRPRVSPMVLTRQVSFVRTK